MHIRQLLVAGVILFGTAQMEAGRKEEENPWEKKKSKTLKWATWAEYRKLNNANNKRLLNSQETNEFNFLRSSFDDKAKGQEIVEQPERYNNTEFFDIDTYGSDMDGQKNSAQ